MCQHTKFKISESTIGVFLLKWQALCKLLYANSYQDISCEHAQLVMYYRKKHTYIYSYITD